MTSYKTIHEQLYNTLPNDNFIVIQEYDYKRKTWRFIGYKCKKCSHHLKHSTSLFKHNLSCKLINKTTTTTETVKPIIKNKFGTDWTPLNL